MSTKIKQKKDVRQILDENSVKLRSAERVLLRAVFIADGMRDLFLYQNSTKDYTKRQITYALQSGSIRLPMWNDFKEFVRTNNAGQQMDDFVKATVLYEEEQGDVQAGTWEDVASLINEIKSEASAA